MTNPLQILRSTVASNVPTLGTGATDNNIGYNSVDGILYWLDDTAAVQPFDLKAGATKLLLTVTASASSSMDFTSNIDSTFKLYRLDLIDIILADEPRDIFLRTSTDGGSIFDFGASDYGFVKISRDSDGNTRDGASASASARIGLNNGINRLGLASGEAFNARIYIWNPAGTNFTQISWEGTYISDAGVGVLINGQGWRNSAANVDAIRILPGGVGNIASGEGNLYGMVR